MQVQVDIAFEQLLKVVKKLPVGQLRQLKAEIEKEDKVEKSKIDENLSYLCKIKYFSLHFFHFLWDLWF